VSERTTALGPPVVGAGAGDGSVAGTPATPSSVAPVHRSAPRARRRLWVVGVVLVGAFGFLLFKGLGGSINYFETVDQAVQQKAMLGTRTFRLEGVVVPGSVHRNRNGVSFVAAGTVHRVAVVNYGNPPQLFQPDIPVVVVGHFSGSTFISNQLIVDHSATYVQQHPTRVTVPTRIAP